MGKQNYKDYLWHIYTLTCPLCGQVHYVGITRQNLNRRFSHHLTEEESTPEKWKSNPAKRNWIASLRHVGLTPIVQEVDTIYGNQQLAHARERYWIGHYLELGYTLLNINGMPEEAILTIDYWYLCFLVSADMLAQCNGQVAGSCVLLPLEVVENSP